ncbi:hypothetical protein [Serratia fonticola]|uniref:hypothetical protein n=1 Tax=Serratia fonticola TaxID=47917 RepID=UPI003AB04F9C
MKELDDFTVERLQRIIRNADGVTSPTYFEVSPADIAALARIALAAKTAEPVDISFIEGMEVSVDVSTCDADADHRYFGTVTEVSELDSAEKGYILLVKDAKPNFPAIPDSWKLMPIAPTPEMEKAISDGIYNDLYTSGIYADLLAAAPTPPTTEK